MLFRSTLIDGTVFDSSVERGYASAISVVLFVLMVSINTLAVKALRKVGS